MMNFLCGWNAIQASERLINEALKSKVRLLQWIGLQKIPVSEADLRRGHQHAK